MESASQCGGFTELGFVLKPVFGAFEPNLMPRKSGLHGRGVGERLIALEWPSQHNGPLHPASERFKIILPGLHKVCVLGSHRWMFCCGWFTEIFWFYNATSAYFDITRSVG